VDTLGPDEGRLVWIGGLGVRFMIEGSQTGGRFALVEHPMKPGVLAAPMHTHANEDEYSYVLEGTVGMRLDDRELVATPGMLVFKPRGVPHTFWNAGDTQARLLELISPAGFEQYFAELATILLPDGSVPREPLRELLDRYQLAMDGSSVPKLIAKHNVRLG
jgi:quercetin dioxygenase-like cupin family protein